MTNRTPLTCYSSASSSAIAVFQFRQYWLYSPIPGSPVRAIGLVRCRSTSRTIHLCTLVSTLNRIQPHLTARRHLINWRSGQGVFSWLRSSGSQFRLSECWRIEIGSGVMRYSVEPLDCQYGFVWSIFVRKGHGATHNMRMHSDRQNCHRACVRKHVVNFAGR